MSGLMLLLLRGGAAVPNTMTPPSIIRDRVVGVPMGFGPIADVVWVSHDSFHLSMAIVAPYSMVLLPRTGYPSLKVRPTIGSMKIVEQVGFRFPIKQDDLRPYLQVQFFNPDGTPRDVTPDTIRFVMKSGTTIKVNQLATKVNAAQGIVEYRWAVGDTNTPKDYRAEFELNGNETFPKETYITVSVIPDLN